MKLLPEHYNQLKAALLDGFGVKELDATLRAIGYDLSDIAVEQSNRPMVFHDVIEAAQKGDWIDALVAAMKRDNPTNKKVNALPDHFPDADVTAVAANASLRTPGVIKPPSNLPPDWPEPAIPYTFVSATQIISKSDGKEMVLVPGGDFLFGRDKIKRYLPPYWIDRTPVTNSEYKRFLKANPDYNVPLLEEDWAKPYSWDVGRRTYPFGKAQHPVVLVTWRDALAYADWAGKQLPTGQEWEKAARGEDGRVYAWGDEWRDNHANTVEAQIGGTSPVEQFAPRANSPYGCIDMCGNVWEWTATEFEVGYYSLRGGSWNYDQNSARVDGMSRFGSDESFVNLGFRLCVPAL
ncbi:MAG: formylglycine-generating enzyme family protein [Anaerolineae bacterium]|nr:formylglycine-generating enzyme family protein [Anaerolineae bacterium]